VSVGSSRFFVQQPLDVCLTFVGHLAKDGRGFRVIDGSRQAAALLHPSAHRCNETVVHSRLKLIVPLAFPPHCCLLLGVTGRQRLRTGPRCRYFRDRAWRAA